MKMRAPSKMIEVCDICRRESVVLTKCVSCGKEYCHICEAIMAGCVHQPQICMVCGEDKGVKAVVEKYAKPLHAMLKKRDAELLRAAKPH